MSSPFAPCTSFGLIYALGLWQRSQLVVAGSATDFSAKPVSTYSYFSTGPFWSLVFSVSSCSFFFFNHSFAATGFSTCLSRSLNMLAGFVGLLCCDPMISFEALLPIVHGFFLVYSFSQKLLGPVKSKYKRQQKAKLEFVACVPLRKGFSSKKEGAWGP